MIESNINEGRQDLVEGQAHQLKVLELLALLALLALLVQKYKYCMAALVEGQAQQLKVLNLLALLVRKYKYRPKT